ncbi:MAG: YdcF family protein [Atopobiaceae bacterium]|jgi:uncharacterized SAM-binding protein YcdF (DUF218 family)|nr:YdcF family protein [Atopobiaceae bacterium]MCH4180093.1 YdcF family protein [Atopobiaceae bacterium]MCH4213855.1 YdcF family protein [Atopobiaceae bacterium]MCH4229957.1 YdcF family protein [Atopobiaceae bacterium]MCH4275682.1 YdcF family protein [Atopobiaceae bacterium]
MTSIAVASWVVFGILATWFVLSFAHERRLYANAILLGGTLLVLLVCLLLTFDSSPARTVVLLLVAFGMPLFLVVFSVVFVVDGITTVRREGASLSSMVGFLFVVGMWGAFAVALWLLFGSWGAGRLGTFVAAVGALLLCACAYVLFTFFSLVIYSWFYRLLPRRKDYDYIVVLGAGLMPDGTPTPLLADRLARALDVWEGCGRRPSFVTSGGKGSDEAMSEAASMAVWLEQRGVGVDEVILEDRSTTTLENMRFSKEVMDARGPEYSCVFVTNDFHVFRAATCARMVGLKAEGVGCRTAAWFWPSAFVREYVAIMRRHLVLPVVLLVLWALLLMAALG